MVIRNKEDYAPICSLCDHRMETNPRNPDFYYCKYCDISVHRADPLIEQWVTKTDILCPNKACRQPMAMLARSIFAIPDLAPGTIWTRYRCKLCGSFHEQSAVFQPSASRGKSPFDIIDDIKDKKRAEAEAKGEDPDAD